VATILDALVVTLGLDASAFTKGRKDIERDFGKTKDSAVSTAKNVEAAGKQAALFFSKMRTEVLALLGTFVAARGIKEFIADLTSGDAQVGRLSASLGVSVEVLGAWRNAAEAIGGTAAGVTGSFQSLASSLAQFQMTGEGGAAIGTLNSLMVQVRDGAGHVKNAAQIWTEALDAIEKRHLDPTKAAELVRMLGGGAEMVNLLMMGHDARAVLLAQQAKIGVANERDVKAAQALQTAFVNLQHAFTETGRVILTMLTPTISRLLGELQRWVSINRVWLAQNIGDEIRNIAAWVKAIDWSKVAAGAASFAQSVREAVDAVGGLVRIVEVLFALWAGAKFAAMIAAISTMTTALGGATSVAAGIAAALAPILAPLAVLAGSHGGEVPAGPERDKLDRGDYSDSPIGRLLKLISPDTADLPRVPLSMGAPGAALAAGGVSSVSHDNRSSSSVNIGTIIVNTAATDAPGIARSIGGAVERNAFTTTGNSGVQ
jgi:hypothetical protein